MSLKKWEERKCIPLIRVSLDWEGRTIINKSILRVVSNDLVLLQIGSTLLGDIIKE